MAVGNAIRMMCRAPKSRAGDHFEAAIGLASLLEGKKPTIPDWAHDMHTATGKRMGRGVEHFRTEGTKLVPAPKAADPYEDEAYRLCDFEARGAQGRRRWQALRRRLSPLPAPVGHRARGALQCPRCHARHLKPDRSEA